MVKNIPTIERSTKIRFGKNTTDNQADNTIVFNASNVEFDVTTSGGVYISPVRVKNDLTNPNMTMLAYNSVTKEITDSGVPARDKFGTSFDNAVAAGNATSNTILLTNEDTGLVANGNIVANYFVGDGSQLTGIVTDLQSVTNNGNTTSNTIQFTNSTTSLVASSNVVIDGNLTVNGAFSKIDTVNTSIKDAIVELGKGNTTSDLGLIMDRPDSNVTVGFREGTDELVMAYTDSSALGSTIIPLTTKDLDVRVYGNVEAKYFTGDASLLSNIPSTLQSVTDNGNTTSNTIQFTNNTVSLTTTGNVTVGSNISNSLFEVVSRVEITPEFRQSGQTIQTTSSSENMGWSVSISGDGTRAVVGAPYSGASNTGRVAVYDSGGSRWTQIGSDIVGQSTDAYLGKSVAISYDGSRIAIGNDTNNKVMIYELVNSVWTQLGNDITGTGGFGYAVALSSDGSYVVVGTDGGDYAEVYEWSGSNWSKRGSTLSWGSLPNGFGNAVDISSDGSRIVIGIPEEGSGLGRLRVYDYNGSQWQIILDAFANTISGQTDSYQHYSTSVGISADGSRIIVSAAASNTVQSFVHVIEYDGSNWSQVGNTLYGDTTNGQFGHSAAISSDGSRIVVGAYNTGRGYVQIYELDNNQWNQIGANLVGVSPEDEYGWDVDISGDGTRVIVGIPGTTSTFTDGAVKLYKYVTTDEAVFLGVDRINQRVGIMTDNPTYTLDVNGNSRADSIYVTNTDIGVVATGNVEASYFIGDGSQLTGLVTDLESVANNGNTTSNTIQFTNTDVGLVATGNVEANYFIGDGSQLTGLVTDLESVANNGNTTSNTIQFTNADVGIVATGNVEANYFIGDGSQLSNVATTLQAITDNGNTTSNTVQFTNADVGIVATGNVEANYFIGNGLDVSGTVNTDSITATNSDVGIVATGNVEANYFIGDGSQLTGLVTDLESVANNGNTTSNTIQFTNPTTAFTTDLTSNVGLKLEQLANVNITTPQTDHLLVYDGSDWVNEYNIHNFIKVHNTTGSTLYKGNVVYIVDSFNNNVANVALAKSDSSSTMPAIGLIHEDILTGQEGSAVAYGKVQGIDTTGFTEGQTVYVSNTSSGNIMNTKPYGPTDQIQNVGICIKEHQTNGVVFVTGVGRSNDIPNAPIVTDPNYVYVNDQNNDLKKIEPANLLTQLQTLQQVTDTSNTTSNTVQLTNTDVGLVATGNVEANYFVADGIYIPVSNTTVSTKNATSGVSTGVSVEWATRIAGTASDSGQDILTDSGGNTYTIGNYSSSPLTLYNSDTTAFGTTLTNSGSDDVFIAKYNTSGVVQWATRIAGTGSDEVSQMSLDSGGNMYVIGYYASTSLIFYNADGSSFGTTLTNSGSNDTFIAKYNTSGVVQWVTRIAGTAYDSGNGISVDNNDNVYVTGNYVSSPLTLYNANGTAFGTTLAKSGSSGSDTYIAKYNTNGVVQWATRIAGTSTEIGYSVSTDSDGNVYAVGYYRSSTLTLYNADGTAFGTTLPKSGSSTTYDVYIAKYNTSGAAQWVTRIAGTSSDYARRISTDSGGNVYVLGNYYSTSLFFLNADGSSSGTSLPRLGSSDLYIAKYNTNGVFQWATRIVGTSSELGYDMHIDSGGNVYVTGYYNSTTCTLYNVDGTAFGTTLPNPGSNSNCFLAKYNTSGVVQWAARIDGTTGNDYGYGISVDNDDNVYVAGYYSSSSLTLYNTNGTAFGTTLSNSGGNDTFIAKYALLYENYYTAIDSSNVLVINTNVGIGTTDPVANLHVTGNAYVSSNLEVGGVNVDSITVTNSDVGIVATGNVQANYFIGDGSQLQGLSSTLEDVVTNSNTTSNTVQFTNTDVGIVATGNVQANYFIGDGSQLQGLSSTLEDVVTNSNITSNTVQFTNTDVGIVATGNVEANTFIGNVTVTESLIVNTGGVTKKFYSYEGTIPDQTPTTSSNISLTFTSNIFYAKVVAHLVEDETEFSNMSLEVGGGSRTGGTTPNLKLGSVSVFGNASTNPWDSAVDVSTYAGSLEITPSATINNGDTPGTKPEALYNIFVEYITPDHVNGRLSSISLGGTTVKTFNY